jgi:hypothetical protein
VFTEIHEMIEGIHKLSGIMRESAQLSIVLAIASAVGWIALALVLFTLRGFDFSGVGLLPVIMILLSIYLACRVVDHEIRTLRFTAEWDRRYSSLLELERKMLTDLDLSTQDYSHEKRN